MSDGIVCRYGASVLSTRRDGPPVWYPQPCPRQYSFGLYSDVASIPVSTLSPKLHSAHNQSLQRQSNESARPRLVAAARRWQRKDWKPSFVLELYAAAASCSCGTMPRSGLPVVGT